MAEVTIQIDSSTLEETVHDLTPEFPYMTDYFDMHQCPDSTFPWHWHSQVEFFTMREGSIEYHVPGGVEVFHKGEGAFVNSNVLHLSRAHTQEPCLQEEHLFLPLLVSGFHGSDIETKYVLPVTGNSSLELFRLRPHVPEHRQMMELMAQAHRVCGEKPLGYEILVRDLISRLWLLLFSATRELHSSGGRGQRDTARTKQMLSFLSGAYGRKVSLKEIADSAFVGERECLRIFQRTLGITPWEALTQKRLNRACELLRDTGLSVLEISGLCGFSGSSYFGKVFKERFGVSPKAYREEKR